MFLALSILGLLLVAVTMGLSLAHALEFPGKLRLDEASYRTVQAIPASPSAGSWGRSVAWSCLPSSCSSQRAS
jgi:hypothetical protein